MSSEHPDSHEQQPRRKNLWTLLAIALVAVLILLFVITGKKPLPPEPLPLPAEEPREELPAAPLSEPEPAPEAPPAEPDVPEAVPLPDLNSSDRQVIEELTEIPGGTQLLPLLVREEMIRKWVRTVVNLAEGEVVHQYRPINSPSSAFQVSSEGAPEDQRYRLDPANYRRYTPYTRALAALDSQTLVVLYRRYYPLLEKAYAEQGENKGDLNEVVLTAINNLLAAPDTDEELLLSQPAVMYTYSDPTLERLPATHKLLLRIGPDNRRSLKESLRKLQSALQQ